MFDSRIFYLQMTETRTRPQLVSTTRRRDPRPQHTTTPRHAAGR
jgi:hypothetical protein